MKKRAIGLALTAAMGVSMLSGATVFAADDVLEFYHGYYHEESEWPAAKVMRDIYDEFAKAHACLLYTSRCV